MSKKNQDENHAPNELPDPKNTINNPVLNITSMMSLFEFQELHPRKFFTYVRKKLGTAIQQNEPEVVLFIMPKLNYAASIKKSDYGNVLQLIKTHAVETEDYETEGECNTLLEKHTVNVLLSEL